MRKFRYTLILIFAVSAIYAQPVGYTKVEDFAKMEKEILEKSKNLSSLNSNFTQEKTMAYLDEVIVSKGDFWYKHPNKVRWQYNEPFEYVISINDNRFTIKDGGKINQFDTKSNPAFRELNSLIVSIAKGDLISDDRFEIEPFENSENYFLKLTPKDANMKNFISMTELFIDKATGVAIKIIMYESESDYTVISFSNSKLNEEISDSIFDIK